MEISDILSQNKIFTKYEEFPLKNPINMKEDYYQRMIYNLNIKKNQEAYYNPRTYKCDLIGIIDINKVRYYDFDDITWTLINKGIDVSTNKTIYD